MQAQWVCSRAENSAIQKRSIIITRKRAKCISLSCQYKASPQQAPCIASWWQHTSTGHRKDPGWTAGTWRRLGPQMCGTQAHQCILQLAGHPIMRPKTSQESMKTCHAVWSEEREDIHGQHTQQQARENDSHHSPWTVEIQHRHCGTQRDTLCRNWRPSGDQCWLRFLLEWQGSRWTQEGRCWLHHLHRSHPQAWNHSKRNQWQADDNAHPLAGNTHLTLISTYTPMMTYPEEDKEQFYQVLWDTLHSVPRNDKLLLVGDFNERTGGNSGAWPTVTGPHGLGRENANGLLLLTLCSESASPLPTPSLSNQKSTWSLGCTHAQSTGTS